MLNMSTLQERITLAYKNENERRLNKGERKLTKTALWKAAGLSSSSASHWFSGTNGMDFDVAVKIAPLLNVNPYWLFDESQPMTKRGPDLAPVKIFPTHLSDVSLRVAELVNKMPAEDQEKFEFYLTVEKHRREISATPNDPIGSPPGSMPDHDAP